MGYVTVGSVIICCGIFADFGGNVDMGAVVGKFKK